MLTGSTRSSFHGLNWYKLSPSAVTTYENADTCAGDDTWRAYQVGSLDPKTDERLVPVTPDKCYDFSTANGGNTCVRRRRCRPLLTDDVAQDGHECTCVRWPKCTWLPLLTVCPGRV
jgi:hypothetical protein